MALSNSGSPNSIKYESEDDKLRVLSFQDRTSLRGFQPPSNSNDEVSLGVGLRIARRVLVCNTKMSVPLKGTLSFVRSVESSNNNYLFNTIFLRLDPTLVS